jgi:hypothetical protein
MKAEKGNLLTWEAVGRKKVSLVLDTIFEV